MNKIIWKNSYIPHFEVKTKSFAQGSMNLCVPLVREFEVSDDLLIDLPDGRAYRSMSRAGVLLSAACLPAAEVLKPFLDDSSFSVGIYCAVENGGADYNTADVTKDTPPEEFAVTYKKHRNAKQYLKQLPNLAGAQLGIFLNIMGPLNIFTHSVHASLHAIEQAEFDLEHGVVNAALICSSFSLDDPLCTLRARRDAGDTKVISEGSAGIVLVKDPSSQFRLSHSLKSDDSVSFGLSQQIILTASKE